MPRRRVHARRSCCCKGYRRTSRRAGVRNNDVYLYFSDTAPDKGLKGACTVPARCTEFSCGPCFFFTHGFTCLIQVLDECISLLVVSAQSSCPNLETYDAANANDGPSSPLASRDKDVFGGGEEFGGENRGNKVVDIGRHELEEKLTNTVSNESTAQMRWGFSEVLPLRLGEGRQGGLIGPGKRVVELVISCCQRRTLGASAVGLAMTAAVQHILTRPSLVAAGLDRAAEALARATGMLAAARAIDLVSLGMLLESDPGLLDQRAQFVKWVLEGLRARWWQGGLLLDAHVFTEQGFVRLDPLDLDVPDTETVMSETDYIHHHVKPYHGNLPPEGQVHISAEGRSDLSVSHLGHGVSALPAGSWGRKLDRVCLEAREKLQRRNLPTRQDVDSRPDEWTSTSAPLSSAFDAENFLIPESDSDSGDQLVAKGTGPADADCTDSASEVAPIGPVSGRSLSGSGKCPSGSAERPIAGLNVDQRDWVLS